MSDVMSDSIDESGLTVAKIRRRTVAGMAGYRLVTKCRGCRAERSVEVDNLPDRYRSVLWRTFIAAMRCRECRCEASTVTRKSTTRKRIIT